MKFIFALSLLVGFSAHAVNIDYPLNGILTNVSMDTGTPANSKPLPISYLNASGVRTNLSTETTLVLLDADLVTMSAKLPATLGQKTSANSLAVVMSSDFVFPLPTGAATAANQVTGNTSVGSIDTKTPALVGGSVPSVLTAGSALVGKVGIDQTTPGTTNLVALAANQSVNVAQINGVTPLMGAGNTGTGSARVTIASDQAVIPVSPAAGATGNSPGSSTVSTVATITAPASAMGFILMNLDTSTTNMRYRIGATAAVGSGQQLQPGRDTGFIPCGANISIIAESGTVNYDIQWVVK